MNKKNLVIIAIVLQIVVLLSFIVRYEYLKAIGTTVYVPLRGYDPTDIFRGDYVNLSYELPYIGSNTGNIYDSKVRYAIPEIQGNRVRYIMQITDIEPVSGPYFRVKNSQTHTSQDIILVAGSEELLYRNTSCENRTSYHRGEMVEYEFGFNQGVVNYISGTSKTQSDDSAKLAKIKSISLCVTVVNFRTLETDRWFVKEGTGLDVEKKIRGGNMYAEWKVGSDGTSIITNIVEENKIPK